MCQYRYKYFQQYYQQVPLTMYQACTNHVSITSQTMPHQDVPTSPYHTPHVDANSSTKCLIHELNIYVNHMPKNTSIQPMRVL